MKHTFFLKEPKGQNKTLIYFSCYFKLERKQFKYSTGEKIKPLCWNFSTNTPIAKGKNRSSQVSSLNLQLNRYSDVFESIVAMHKKIGEVLTANTLRLEFNKHFKKSAKGENLFFSSYDDFTSEKIKRLEWKVATIKRYRNIKNHLIAFEETVSYKLTFSNITEQFYTDFTDYCYSTLNHSTNTFARNIGLFKTYMYWCLKKRITYSDDFKNFKKPERVITDEVALNIDQVKSIFEFQPKTKSLEKARDIFVFQCLTGLRYGELRLVNKRNIIDDVLFIKEDKDVTKSPREIPLFKISKYILKKYDYKLPLISNQKQNDLIKSVFEEAEFDFDVEYTRTKNRLKEVIIKPFYKRISTHSARRTFITVMKKKGIADKTIMKMTGHKDLKTFNSYYKVDTEAKIDAINLAFGSIEIPKLKKA